MLPAAAPHADEARLRRTIHILETTGQFVPPEAHVLHEPELPMPGGCFLGIVRLFRHATGATRVQTSEPGAPQPKKKPDKLEQASEALQARATSLQERATALRNAASVQFKAGDKRLALQTMRRAKAVEAQYEQASRTCIALEGQMDLLAQSQVQKEVAAALAGAVKKSKKLGAGLLSRTETAVEDSQELLDQQNDVSTVLSEFRPTGACDDDDDDLLAELDAMVGTSSDAEPAVLPVGAPVAPSATPATLAKLLPSVPLHGQIAPGEAAAMVATA